MSCIVEEADKYRDGGSFVNHSSWPEQELMPGL